MTTAIAPWVPRPETTQDWWESDYEAQRSSAGPERFTIRLFPKQRQFFDFKDRFAAFMGGIGSGKTRVGVEADIYYGLMNEGSLQIIVGPTLVNLKQTTMRRFFERCPRSAIKAWKVSDRELTLRSTTRTISVPGEPTNAATGSQFLFWGADDEGVIDRMRGLELARFHIDEGALIAALIWPILVGRLRQPGFPHQGRVTSTHKGPDWIFQEFEPSDPLRVPAGPVVHSSIYENPTLDPAYVRSLEVEYGQTEWAKQELLGLHAKFGGLVYPMFDESLHVWHGDLPRLDRIELAVDWGYHYAPVTAYGHDPQRDRWMVAGEWYGRAVTVDQQIEGALALVARLGFTPDAVNVYPDPSRPEAALLMRQKGRGLNFPEFKAGKVQDGIIECQRLLGLREDGERHFMVHESAIGWINEINGYLRKEKRGEPIDSPARYSEEPADGQVDHAMDAWRYWAMGSRDATFSTNAVTYMREVSPVCTNCGKRFYRPVGAKEAPCTHCGTINRRD